MFGAHGKIIESAGNTNNTFSVWYNLEMFQNRAIYQSVRFPFRLQTVRLSFRRIKRVALVFGY